MRSVLALALQRPARHYEAAYFGEFPLLLSRRQLLMGSALGLAGAYLAGRMQLSIAAVQLASDSNGAVCP